MLVHLYCLRHIAGGGRQTVGGLVLTPAPASQLCSCSSALSLTLHNDLLKPFLHHRRPPPPDNPLYTIIQAVKTYQSTTRAESLRRTASGHSGNWESTGFTPACSNFSFSGGGQKREDFLTSRRPSNVVAEEPCNHPPPSKLPLMG